MHEHRLFTENTKMKVYFCPSASPWERGMCENTNGLIRHYFPKGIDFKQVSGKELTEGQNQLNEKRPGKVLGFWTGSSSDSIELKNICVNQDFQSSAFFRDCWTYFDSLVGNILTGFYEKY